MAGRNGRTVLVLLGLLVAMAGLTAASVPLYRMVCKVTGWGGTTQTAVAAPGAAEGARMIRVRFDTSVAKDVPWRFEPEQREMTVRLGENAIAVFRATNTGREPVTGTATFNVTPDKAGRYFSKIQCFCFTEQVLAPGQTAEMPVSFFVDPALAQDPHADEVSTITLSYTFFRTKEPRS